MTSFKTAFKLMFKRKAKPVHLIFGLQLLGTIILTILNLNSSQFSSSHYHLQTASAQTTITGFPAAASFAALILFSLVPLAFLAYLIWSSRLTLQINRSQTWRLLPIANSKFQLANFVSSILSFIYLGLWQLVIGVILLLPVASQGKVAAEISNSWTRINTEINWGVFWEFIGICLALAFAWYLTVAFLAFSSQAVMDFLPIKSSKFVQFILILLIMTIIIVLITNLGNFISLGNFAEALMTTSVTRLGVVLGEYLLYDLILAGLNQLLFAKFIEAKQNN